MRRSILAALSCLLLLPSCATIFGTAVSPITGGVDLCRVGLRNDQWYFMPFVFVGGAVAGPFVAFYNGVNYDPTIFRNFQLYWVDFDDVFARVLICREKDHKLCHILWKE